MKKAKKVMSLVAACFMATSLFAGCGDDAAAVKKKIGNRTVLAIGNTDAGLTDVWLKAAAKEFEEMYSDWQGENGKVGVYVEITNKRNDYSTASLAQNMPYNGLDLYFMSECTYSVLINAGVLADLTDVVTTDLYDTEGEIASGTGVMSIEDKMYQEFKDHYNVNGHYYALPFFATPVGITYDADLFNSKKLFLNAQNQFGATYNDIASGNCSKGPDGKLGTFDDGLPATWEEFKKLLQKMKGSGIDPFIWDGQNHYQRAYGFMQLMANYEGKNDFDLNLTLNGHSNSLNEDITKENGYKLIDQGGRRAALQAISDIIKGNYYSADAGKPTVSHTNAQLLYIGSVNKNKKIAFLLEGSWWENESRDDFVRMGKTKASLGYGQRNFKLLPIPRFVGTPGVTDSINTRHVLAMTTAANSAIVVSKNAKQLDLAKEFVKFLHSRRGLALMSQQSSVLRPFSYSLTKDELGESTKYFQNIYEMWKSDDVDVVYTDKFGRDVLNYPNYLDPAAWVETDLPWLHFKANKTLSVDSEFNTLFGQFKQGQWTSVIK